MTDENGIIEIKDIPLSKYKVVEVKAKEGYALIDKQFYIDLKIDKELIVQNDKIVYIPNAMKNNYTYPFILCLLQLGTLLFIYGQKKYY